jgi:hypothetical protein
MKLVTTLVLAGLLIAAAGWFVKKRDRTQRPPSRQDADEVEGADLGLAADLGDPGDELVEEVTVIATSSGIADVDPEPLAQTAGEGIALDAVEAAHTEIEDLRARLPRPGKGA